MNIDCKQDNNKIILKLSGRLDTVTSLKLAEFEQVISKDKITSLILDLKKLEYLSSAGLRVILKFQKIMNKKGVMEVINVNSLIMEIFDMTGFTEILTIK